MFILQLHGIIIGPLLEYTKVLGGKRKDLLRFSWWGINLILILAYIYVDRSLRTTPTTLRTRTRLTTSPDDDEIRRDGYLDDETTCDDETLGDGYPIGTR